MSITWQAMKRVCMSCVFSSMKGTRRYIVGCSLNLDNIIDAFLNCFFCVCLCVYISRERSRCHLKFFKKKLRLQHFSGWSASPYYPTELWIQAYFQDWTISPSLSLSHLPIWRIFKNSKSVFTSTCDTSTPIYIRDNAHLRRFWWKIPFQWVSELKEDEGDARWQMRCRQLIDGSIVWGRRWGDKNELSFTDRTREGFQDKTRKRRRYENGISEEEEEETDKLLTSFDFGWTNNVKRTDRRLGNCSKGREGETGGFLACR